MKKLLLSICLFIGVQTLSHAQGWEAGGWIGASYYFGDINTEYNLERPNPALGIILRYNFNDRLAFKLSGNYGSVEGDDSYSTDDFQRRRNLSFRSNILEGAAQFEFNFMKYVHGSKDENYTPYLFGGISLFHFNPKAYYEGDWVELQPLGTEGQFRGSEYMLTQPALVYGGGFKFDISYEWSINIEVSARKLFTDYLDDISTEYPDMGELEENRGILAVNLSDRSVGDIAISEPGRQRGNSQDNDMFTFVGITLAYNFAQVQCPWFK